MLEQTSRVISAHQKQRKRSDQYMPANSFRGTAPSLPDLSPSDSYLWRHLKPVMYSSPIEHEETLHIAFFMPVRPFATAPRPLKRGRQSMIRRAHACIDSSGGHFEHLLRIVTG